MKPHSQECGGSIEEPTTGGTRIRIKGLALSAIVAASLLALPLTGCSGSNEPAQSDEPVTASQAFSSECLWFHSNGEPSKDGKVSTVYAFDGAGNVTVYDTDMSYGDLNGKSNEEIIELAQQQNRENKIAELENDIKVLSQDNDELQADLDNMNEQKGYYASDPDTLGVIESDISEAQSRISDNNAKIDEDNTKLDELNSGSYVEEAQPFSLSIETDDTGNNAVSETLTVGDDSIEFSKRDMSWTVYDLYFLGYDGLYTAVEQGHHGFILDTPGTEGVEVD